MKSKKVVLKSGNLSSSGILLQPTKAKSTGVILAHGAGGTMHSRFLDYFHNGIADAGYSCLKFNFFYSEAGRKFPDPQNVLTACYEKALEAMPGEKQVIGGKSMGGRMASYIAADPRVAGLLFLGYPLHAPGKTEMLRDQHLYEIHKPMLFCSGTNDPFARIDLLKKVTGKIGRNAATEFVENGGHSFETSKKASGKSEKEILAAVLSAILHWLQTNFE